MTTYTIKSTTFTRQIKGTPEEIIRAAVALDEEYQPAYGTEIILGDDVLINLDERADLVEQYQVEALAVGDDATAKRCNIALREIRAERAGERDVDATWLALLAEILATRVEAQS